MMSQQEQRRAAKKFSQEWENRGYEKGESAPFWLSLINLIFGIKNPAEVIKFEDSVVLENTSFIDARIPSTNVLIEQKSINIDLNKEKLQSDGSYLTPFEQAKRYADQLPWSERPRWIVISNFKKINIHDMEHPTLKPEVVLLENLETEYPRLSFLVRPDDENIVKMKKVSLEAGELIGKLYDALLEEYKNPKDEKTLEDLNTLSVRLVFCFYAEDSYLLGRPRMFHDYLKKHQDNQFRIALIRLFKVFNQKPEERDPYLEEDLAEFPYINGGLFNDDNIEIPRMNDKIIDIILNQASFSFDWSNISPTIFGGVFESTLNPETRRSGGMHYTSVENIHKVTDPLFMNELNEEFEKIQLFKTYSVRQRRLEEFQDKIASLKFLDPAAGSGNFLTETYISLRRLENEVIRNIFDGEMVLGDVINPIKVSIDQFYGIEINDFAVTVARTALWIAESQMMKETEDIIHMDIDFLPIKSDATIIEGNALEMNWNSVIDARELNYIMGNPPFVGSRYMDDKQSNNLKTIFNKKTGLGKLDYVTGWYKKAAMYISSTKIEAAFVSTNSITQGDQVATIWDSIFDKHNLIINFAYRTFKWSTEALNSAAVHCVIIGFSQIEKDKKLIFTSSNNIILANNINGYLLDAPDVIIKSLTTPLCNIPELKTGTRVGAQEYVFTEKQKKNFVKKEPVSTKYFHEYLGGQEFLNNQKRYCLYLDDAPITDLVKMPNAIKIIENVSDDRIEKNHKLKDFPKKYIKLMIPEQDYLFIPQLSTDKRKYYPMGFVSKDIWLADPHFALEGADLYSFGILTSSLHNIWIKLASGELETRYRYSSRLVYNTFPWPKPTETQKNKIKLTAQNILKTREKHPDVKLAKLYDKIIMPSDLKIAHRENDIAVMQAYGFDWKNMTNTEFRSELMKMYEKLTKSK